MSGEKKSEIRFTDKEAKPKEPPKYLPCSICNRPIWHSVGGPMRRVCSEACRLSRTFLGGGRSNEDTWEQIRKHRLSDTWGTLEDFWRDMGAGYFPGAFLLRRDRSAKHSKENSFWATLAQAKQVKKDLIAATKKKTLLPSGRTIGSVSDMYGINIHIFQWICGAIAKRWGLTIVQVEEEFALAPPPPNWQDVITVQHQGQEYSIRRLGKETGISFLSFYWRWMKGMFLIDDEIAHRIARTRVRGAARARQQEKWKADYRPFNEG